MLESNDWKCYVECACVRNSMEGKIAVVLSSLNDSLPTLLLSRIDNQDNLLLQHSIAAFIFELAVMVTNNVIIIIRVHNMQQLTATVGKA